MDRPLQLSDLPPGYVPQIERARELITRWCSEVWQGPGLPDLRFFDPGHVMYIANLDERGRKYLAATPDADRLLAYIDSETARKMTVFQATCALRLAGFLPP